jgi:tRNA (adenine37-N6)-methyltransferase
MSSVVLKPIGVVVEGMPVDRTSVWDRWRDISVVKVFEEYCEGLKGLEYYSHIYLLFYMHQVSDQALVIRPRGRPDMPEVGVFAFRGRVRPNPIGLTVCRLLEVRGCYLKVVGLDAYPGTPILDIKPYDYYDIVENPIVPEWFLRLWRERDSQPSP